MSYAGQVLLKRIQPWVPFVLMVIVIVTGLSGTGRVATGDAPHILAIPEAVSMNLSVQIVAEGIPAFSK